MVGAPNKILLLTGVGVVLHSMGHLVLSLIARPALALAGPQLCLRGATVLQAHGGGEYDVSDDDITFFYKETISGNGGNPPKGTVAAELIVKFFHGEFTDQGFVRYSGMWKGPLPGAISKRDIAGGMEKLKALFESPNPVFISKGGVGYKVDETQKVEDDGKGYIWVAAEVSPGGFALETFKSTPYGKRALFCAKQDNVAEMFEKIDWDLMNRRIQITLGGPDVQQR